MLKPLRIFIVLGVLLGAVYYVIVSYVQQIALPLTENIYTVPAGSSAAQLCRNWQQQQLVSNTQCSLLKVYLRLHPSEAPVLQGVYRTNSAQTLLEVLALFRSGKEAQFALTLIEGETVQLSLNRLQNAQYLQLDIATVDDILQMVAWPEEWGEQPTNSEALLYPDTYYYTANSTASELLQRAQRALITELSNAWQQRQEDLPLQNPYQLLTLASIIEKESSHPPEKTLVASVFVNRLRDNMR